MTLSKQVRELIHEFRVARPQLNNVTVTEALSPTQDLHMLHPAALKILENGIVHN